MSSNFDNFSERYAGFLSGEMQIGSSEVQSGGETSHAGDRGDQEGVGILNAGGCGHSGRLPVHQTVQFTNPRIREDDYTELVVSNATAGNIMASHPEDPVTEGPVRDVTDTIQQAIHAVSHATISVYDAIDAVHQATAELRVCSHAKRAGKERAKSGQREGKERAKSGQREGNSMNSYSTQAVIKIQ